MASMPKSEAKQRHSELRKEGRWGPDPRDPAALKTRSTFRLFSYWANNSLVFLKQVASFHKPVINFCFLCYLQLNKNPNPIWGKKCPSPYPPISLSTSPPIPLGSYSAMISSLIFSALCFPQVSYTLIKEKQKQKLNK